MKSQNSPEAAKVQHTFKTNYILESCKPRSAISPWFQKMRSTKESKTSGDSWKSWLTRLCFTPTENPPPTPDKYEKIKSSLVVMPVKPQRCTPWSPRIFSSTLRLHRALSGASDPQGNSERLMVYWVFTLAFNKCECNAVYLQYYVYIYHIYTLYIYIMQHVYLYIYVYFQMYLYSYVYINIYDVIMYINIYIHNYIYINKCFLWTQPYFKPMKCNNNHHKKKHRKSEAWQDGPWKRANHHRSENWFSFLKTTDVAESGLLNVFYMIYVNTVESIQHEQ